MARSRLRAGPAEAPPGTSAPSGAAVHDRTWTVVDTLPDRVPVTVGEVEAVARYLWPLIEALLREGKR